MSGRILECQWEISDGWTLSDIPTPAYVSEGGEGTAIAPDSVVPPTLLLAQCSFPPGGSSPDTPPLDLSQTEELRFWLRSSRPGDGSEGNPFYLAFEATGDSPELSWQRLLPVKQADVWEFHRLWLGDMPEELREAVVTFRLRRLDASVVFNVALGDVIAGTPEPLQDVESALLQRLDNRFQVNVSGMPTNVSAIVDLPENPGGRTPPYILIIPWSVQAKGERGGSGELIDNYKIVLKSTSSEPTETIETFEVTARPQVGQLQIEYAIDIFAQGREQKTRLLDAILSDFSRNPLLAVSGEPLALIPFLPDPEQVAEFVASPGRTPLFYQIIAPIDTGTRQWQTLILQPLLIVSHKRYQDGEIVRDEDEIAREEVED